MQPRTLRRKCLKCEIGGFSMFLEFTDDLTKIVELLHFILAWMVVTGLCSVVNAVLLFVICFSRRKSPCRW